jgi:hypothetical protein
MNVQGVPRNGSLSQKDPKQKSFMGDRAYKSKKNGKPRDNRVHEGGNEVSKKKHKCNGKAFG